MYLQYSLFPKFVFLFILTHYLEVAVWPESPEFHSHVKLLDWIVDWNIVMCLSMLCPTTTCTKQMVGIIGALTESRASDYLWRCLDYSNAWSPYKISMLMLVALNAEKHLSNFSRLVAVNLMQFHVARFLNTSDYIGKKVLCYQLATRKLVCRSQLRATESLQSINFVRDKLL